MAPDTPPVADKGPPTLYAAVSARNAAGLPSKIEVPGRLAGPTVPLFVGHHSGGSLWAADIGEDGTVRSDGSRSDVLAVLRPGVKLVAAEVDGRVVAVHACARTPAPGRAKPARAAAEVTHRAGAATSRARSGDPYEHRPHELMYSGAVGKILSVS
jgi:hypothetical protein